MAAVAEVGRSARARPRAAAPRRSAPCRGPSRRRGCRRPSPPRPHRRRARATSWSPPMPMWRWIRQIGTSTSSCAEGPVPGDRVVVVGVDEGPVDVEDRGLGHRGPLPGRRGFTRRREHARREAHRPERDALGQRRGSAGGARARGCSATRVEARRPQPPRASALAVELGLDRPVALRGDAKAPPASYSTSMPAPSSCRCPGAILGREQLRRWGRGRRPPGRRWRAAARIGGGRSRSDVGRPQLLLDRVLGGGVLALAEVKPAQAHRPGAQRNMLGQPRQP